MLSWIEISESALHKNYDAFTALLGQTQYVPVLKSNAYGHGLAQVAKILLKKNPEWFAVNYVSEAAELRSLGFSGRIMMCGPYTKDQYAAALAANAEVFVGTQEALEHTLAQKPKLKIHVEFDTGMSRQGFKPNDVEAIIRQCLAAKEQIAGVCMHFANVEDVYDQNYGLEQLAKFAAVRQAFQSAGFDVLFHASSSASALIMAEARLDLCRIGISTYGLWPSQATKISSASVASQTKNAPTELLPVLAWRARTTSVIDIPSGQYVGYGCTYRANHDMKIAVVPVGYYEGYPRIASGHPCYVLLRGKRCPIVGRICMNMMMVDVTNLDNPNIGEIATLIGRDAFEIIHAGDVATWSETIHYEITTRLNGAIPRDIFP